MVVLAVFLCCVMKMMKFQLEQTLEMASLLAAQEDTCNISTQIAISGGKDRPTKGRSDRSSMTSSID